MFNMHLGKMPTHIFLTGKRQIGKSTLISKVLSLTELKYSGLRSISVCDKDKKHVFIISANDVDAENKTKVGVCSNHKVVEQYPEVLDTVGCKLLGFDSDTKLVVIDEIGKLEKDATLYNQKVLSLLERTDIHILGVLQDECDTELAKAIRKHPNVKLFAIRESNRENLIPVVLRLIKGERR